MRLYSSLDKKIVEIEPIKEGEISIYSCGPTVYNRVHIGNIRSYIDWDILHRALMYLGYKVNRVMNFTDVGHMTHDEDFGEDKFEKRALEMKLDPLEISNRYIYTVLEDFSKLNILSPSGDTVNPNWEVNELDKYGWLRATSYVEQMIERIGEMERRGYTYETERAVYFDVTKVDDYTIFTGQTLNQKNTAAREDVEIDSGKKNHADFVLWMKRVGKYANHIMHWDSPWGDGFPGWHIECSTMSIERLGTHFDIHTGGIDHFSLHHPNERAQNIGICGHPVVKYWIHNEFLVDSDNGKLSKSGGALTLPEVIEKGYDPLDLRYLLASVNYRVQFQFSFKALDSARKTRIKIFNKILSLKEENTKGGIVIAEYKTRFEEALNDNLNMSEAFAILNELLKSTNKSEDILTTVYDFDKVFGFNFENIKKEQEDIPSEIQELLKERELARKENNYEKSDRLRDLIYTKGYKVLDTSEGQIVEKI